MTSGMVVHTRTGLIHRSDIIPLTDRLGVVRIQTFPQKVVVGMFDYRPIIGLIDYVS